MLTTLIASGQESKCKGTTKKGEPCHSVIGIKDGYCEAHNPNVIRCGANTSQKKPCRNKVAKVGDKCRFHKQ